MLSSSEVIGDFSLCQVGLLSDDMEVTYKNICTRAHKNLCALRKKSPIICRSANKKRKQIFNVNSCYFFPVSFFMNKHG